MDTLLNQDPSQAPKPYEALPQGDISSYVDLLLEEKKLNPDIRNVTILDHFYGSVLRNFGAEAGLQLLHSITEVRSETFVDNKGITQSWERKFTRKGGFRRAVMQLRDALGSDMFSTPGITVDGEGRFAGFTTFDQLQGYLDTPSYDREQSLTWPEQAETWREAIINEIQRSVEHLDTPGAWENQSALASDIDSVRKSIQEWERALAIGAKAGVDKQVLVHTAERLRDYRRKGIKIGGAALRVTDYSTLFSAPEK